MSTPTTDLSLSSLILKVKEASEIIDSIPNLPDFNEDYKDEYGNQISSTEDYIWSRLAMLGIYQTKDSHEILLSEDCAEGDARRFFCENGNPNIPITRFKRVWRILKGSNTQSEVEFENSKSEMSNLVGMLKPIGQWKDEELVSQYNENCSSEIEEELRKRSKGRRFVIFENENDSKIDIENTLKFLRNARRMENPEVYSSNKQNKYYRLYRVGEFPSVSYMTCPIHKNIIMIDDFCSECGISWPSNISKEAKVFIRLMIEKEGVPHSSIDIRKMIAEASKDMDYLPSNYPNINMIYEDLKREGRLPLLEAIRKNKVTQDPFNVSDENKTY